MQCRHPHAQQLAVEAMVAVGAAGRDAHFGHGPERKDEETEFEENNEGKEGGVAKRSPDVPLVVHQQLDVLNAVVVGVVQPLGQVLLQVRPEVLLRLLALTGRRKSRTSCLSHGCCCAGWFTYCEVGHQVFRVV